VVEAEFAPTGRRTVYHKGQTCILFECDPHEKNEKHLIQILLKPKKEIFNLSKRTKAKVHVDVSPKGIPFGASIFKDNSEAELVIKKIPTKGINKEVALPLINLDETHLWDKGDSGRDPFCLRLTIQNGREQKACLLYGLLVQRMGTLWLGLDPGTTGSCVYAGNTSGDIKPVPLPIPLTDQFVPIMPSAIYFTPEYKGPTQYPYDSSIRVGDPSPLGDPNRIFFSFKRLVGYENVRTFTARSGENIKIRGEDVQSVLVDYLIMETESFLKERPQQAVLVVPNSYTPAKIQLMKECCFKARYLKRVEHIYESEAIVLHYYKKIATETILSLPTTVLVIDFGGSTLNVAVATIDQKRENLVVDMHARMGFNIGGDTITAIFAELIWENKGDEFWGWVTHEKKQSELKKIGFEPFKESKEIPIDKKVQWEDFRKYLWEYAETKKKEPSSYKNLIDLKKKGEINPLLRVLGEIESGIMEVIRIFDPNPDRPIHSIIVAGRASLFDPINEIVSRIKGEIKKKTKKEVKEESIFGDKEGEDRKLCVAEGAAFYGVQKENIRLTRVKSFAHYGMEHYPSAVNSQFKNLIPMGTEFLGNNCINRSVREIDLRYQNRSLSFYQIMSADPNQKNLPIYRKSEIQKFVLDQGEDYLKEGEINIDTDDRCTVKIETNLKERRSEKNFRIEDISTEMDHYTIWRLIT
jgi:DNA-binding ferritin-like protein (Dps family)